MPILCHRPVEFSKPTSMLDFAAETVAYLYSDEIWHALDARLSVDNVITSGIARLPSEFQKRPSAPAPSVGAHAFDAL